MSRGVSVAAAMYPCGCPLRRAPRCVSYICLPVCVGGDRPAAASDLETGFVVFARAPTSACINGNLNLRRATQLQLSRVHHRNRFETSTSINLSLSGELRLVRGRQVHVHMHGAGPTPAH